MKRWVATLLLSFCMSGAAFGHIAAPSNPFAMDGCSGGFSNLEDSWAILGALIVPEHVGIFCFDAVPNQRIKAAVVIPPKAVYEGPSDVTMVLVGPGLPDPSRPVPLGLFEGNGAVFAAARPDEGPFPRRNFLGNWHGPRLDEVLPAAGRYEIRVFSPSDWRGEYFLVTTGDPDRPSADLTQTPLPTPGDLNDDGRVTVEDAVSGLIIAVGSATIEDTYDLYAGDIAPRGDYERLLIPGDGEINLGDVVRMLRRAVGLDTTPEWPD